MRPLLSLHPLAAVLLALPWAAPAHAKKPDAPTVPKVPSIEEVVAAEGFTPTPSQSEIYRPGAVLVPNGRGGHDVVVESCIAAEPSVSIMSQSSIATTLAGGVSARLGVARGAASAGVEKRLSFVDPEQRTIPLAKLRPTDACASGVQTAATFQNLSSAIVLHDVLVAIIKNTVCTKADASGGVVALGAAEAAAYSECVQESDGQVPLGYKAVPLDKVLSLAGTSSAPPVAEGSGSADAATAPPRAATAPPRAATAPPVAQGSGGFGELGSLDVDARLKEQACADAAKEGGLAARAARLEAAARAEQEQAHQAWVGMSGQLDKCTQLALAERGDCILMAEKWLSLAGGMKVSLDAGVETVQTDCGPREAVFAAESQRVVASDVAAAEALLAKLKAADAPAGATAGAPGKAGIEWVSIPGGSFQMGSSSGDDDEKPVHTVRVSSFALMKTEVTFGQYRQCVSAGACTPAHTSDGSCYVYDGSSWKNGTLPSSFQGDEQPAVCVDWEQAQAFAAWAGGRLPTEAEWEYAARSGGKSWTYPWGEETASCSRAVMDDGGNGCGEVRTWPVCSKPAGNSSQGVCDLAGNVWEWVQDGYQDSYSGAPGDGSAWEGSASARVYRGGSWFYTASVLRASNRDGRDPSGRSGSLGFRLAR